MTEAETKTGLSDAKGHFDLDEIGDERMRAEVDPLALDCEKTTILAVPIHVRNVGTEGLHEEKAPLPIDGPFSGKTDLEDGSGAFRFVDHRSHKNSEENTVVTFHTDNSKNEKNGDKIDESILFREPDSLESACVDNSNSTSDVIKCPPITLAPTLAQSMTEAETAAFEEGENLGGKTDEDRSVEERSEGTVTEIDRRKEGDHRTDDYSTPNEDQQSYDGVDVSSPDSQEEESNANEGDGTKEIGADKRQRDGTKCDFSPSKKLRRELRESFQRHNTMLSEYVAGCGGSGDIAQMDRHASKLTAEIDTLRDLARAAELEWNSLLRLKKVKEELLLRLLRKKAVALIEGAGGDPSSLPEDRFPAELRNTICGPSDPGAMNGDLTRPPIGELMSRPAGRLPYPCHLRPPGRQGPTKDVRSIIADYRQRHPGEVPRRGRRARSVLVPRIPQASGGPRYAAPVPRPGIFGAGTLTSCQTEGMVTTGTGGALTNGGMSFKDVLVQYASMAGRQPPPVRLPPPPPYPEVTLHPVSSSSSSASSSLLVNSAPHPIANSQQTNSLLHGILTKACPRQESRFSAFSPTLARLLTAPEKAAVTSPASATPDLADASCGEITITPVHSTPDRPADGSRPRVLRLEDFEEMEAEEDSADRPLVIDEGRSAPRERDRDRVELNESDVPECQGCHRREAQFVCAGCANQWYCSRECQVSAWDDHSEICSG